MSVKLTYLWLDGYDTPNLRSKCKYVDDYEEGVLPPVWSFDGSSTNQARGEDSDCMLLPVKVYENTTDYRIESYIVMCEVVNPDMTPHRTNTRHLLKESLKGCGDEDYWFGIEQEYVFMNEDRTRPFGWGPHGSYPAPQGRYYCGVGGDSVRLRHVVDSHAVCCLDAGIKLSGTNAEVMLSQWEYQIGPCTALEAADDLWVARYLMESIAEQHNLSISLDPKPIEGDWNGSGAHINFSSKSMREVGGQSLFEAIIGRFSDNHLEHIREYGLGNENRLTGNHETQHISKFSSGVADRGASIRIPNSTEEDGVGYLEDRRPASNIDPYRALSRMVETLNQAHEMVLS